MKLLPFIVAATLPLIAAPPEPLVGTWRLESQEINGEAIRFEPLTLKVTQSGDRLAFAFSVPVNDIYFVSMSYTVRLDGTTADVTNGRGEKVGSIQMRSDGPSQYKLVLKGPNRPDSSGKLTVSADGKSLTSEAEAMQGGRTVHSKQVFSRY
ncbi:MAG TPA: hypothetical protein VH640_16690 [Bryobacteraceae bacterium]|jgi:hypothetical protein